MLDSMNVTDHCHRLSQQPMAHHGIFYFFQFNTKSPQFYLVIRPSKNDDLSVFGPPRIVSGLIYPLACKGNETFLCHLG